MAQVLNRVELDEDQWGVLERAARELRADLRREYRPKFRRTFCVALGADRAGRLAQFVLAVSGDFPDLAAALAGRAHEDLIGATHFYYFPEVMAPGCRG